MAIIKGNVPDVSDVSMQETLDEKEFENAPGWAKFINQKLSKVIDDTRNKVNDCVQEAHHAVNTAQEARDLAIEARDGTDELEERVAKLEAENKYLRKMINDQENRSRRNNLKIDGLPEAPNETPGNLYETVQKFFKDTLRLPESEAMRLDRVHRIGQMQHHRSKPRTVILRFNWFEDRQKVWNKRRDLRDTGIWLREDFSKETEETRAKLYPYVQAARAKNMKSTLSVDALIVDGKRYTTETVNQLELVINPSNRATRSNDKMVIFYGKASPLSNFHPAPITVDGILYNCTEQYFQHTKCKVYGDDKAASKVMESIDPAEQKKIGDRLQGDKRDTWLETAHEVMLKANMAKFSQHQALGDYLKSTNPKTLAEANPHDKFWGTGVHIGRRDAFTGWNGHNYMGGTLMHVRQNLM